MKRLSIVIIGAGSAGFGPGSIADVMGNQELREFDVTVWLVDIDAPALERMRKLAQLIKEHHRSPATVKATTDRTEALKDADYVITSVAHRRWDLWQQDFYVPAAYGFPQVFGENGGPGAAFHTLRSLALMMPIAEDMERLCPDAVLINFTNPESRVILGVSRLTSVRSVGLCHGPMETREKIAAILNKPEDEIDLVVGGINHFHLALKITDKKTGADLYPEIDARIDEFDWDGDRFSPEFYRVFGYLTYPDPGHPGEYLQFAPELVGPEFIEWGIGNISFPKSATAEDLDYRTGGSWGNPGYQLWSENLSRNIDQILAGTRALTEKDVLLGQSIVEPTWELAVPIIVDIENDKRATELAGNVLNTGGAISNLPEDAVVEVPLSVGAGGIQPVNVGPLPEAHVGMCRLQISIQNLLVEAYRQKSKTLLLQALMIDPNVNSLPKAREMMERMLRIQSDVLPELR